MASIYPVVKTIRATPRSEVALQIWMDGLSQRGLTDFAVSDATRANTQTLAGAIYKRMNRLQVQIPSPLRHVVCVADPVSKLRPAAAHFTYFRHTEVLLSGR